QRPKEKNMATKFIYFDDEDQSSFIRGISARGNIDVVQEEVKPWPEIIKFFKEKQKSIDGVILDQRLDEKSKEPLRGSSLAQHLRTWSSEKKMGLKNFPIVLFSADEKAKDSFYRDTTAQDLFDVRYSKTSMPPVEELITLADGYKKINETNKLEDLLAFNTYITASDIDYRLVNTLLKKLKQGPTHEFARFFISQVLLINGTLINELVLCSRLGIDLQKSGDSYIELLKKISRIKYKGVFASGWDRWWADKLIFWWESTFPDSESLSMLDAEARVQLLNEKYKIQLIAAEKTPMSRSRAFWTVCVGSDRPIDIVDALRIDNDNLYPWQDQEYISNDEGVKPTNLKKWKQVHPMDKEQLNKLKKLNIKKRPKK
ncbi:MAG: hypothetical protein AAGA64_12060, partial [Bacteroidota bacterium]